MGQQDPKRESIQTLLENLLSRKKKIVMIYRAAAAANGAQKEDTSSVDVLDAVRVELASNDLDGSYVNSSVWYDDDDTVSAGVNAGGDANAEVAQN